MTERISHRPVIETKKRPSWPAVLLCIAVGLAPVDNELFIDIDTELQLEQFKVMWEVFTRNWPSATHTLSPSASGYPRLHITVTLPFVVSETERIVWQSILGSDPFRELMSMRRVMSGSLPATLFKEKRNG